MFTTLLELAVAGISALILVLLLRIMRVIGRDAAITTLPVAIFNEEHATRSSKLRRPTPPKLSAYTNQIDDEMDSALKQPVSDNIEFSLMQEDALGDATSDINEKSNSQEDDPFSDCHGIADTASHTSASITKSQERPHQRGHTNSIENDSLDFGASQDSTLNTQPQEHANYTPNLRVYGRVLLRLRDLSAKLGLFLGFGRSFSSSYNSCYNSEYSCSLPPMLSFSDFELLDGPRPPLRSQSEPPAFRRPLPLGSTPLDVGVKSEFTSAWVNDEHFDDSSRPTMRHRLDRWNPFTRLNPFVWYNGRRRNRDLI